MIIPLTAKASAWVVMISLLFGGILNADAQSEKNSFSDALVRSGENRREIEAALIELPGNDTKYLISNASQYDLVNFTKSQIIENIRCARSVRQMPYLSGSLSEDLWMNWVLPSRVLDEDLDCWRKNLYDRLAPLVKDCATCEEAATVVLKWVWSDHGNGTKIVLKSDAAENRNRTVSQLFASKTSACREYNLLYVAALRSVGIPARHCTASRWIHRDSYHFYTEYWDVQKSKWVAHDTTDEAVEFAQTPDERVRNGRWNAVAYYAFPSYPKQPDLYGKLQWDECVNVTSNISPVDQFEIILPPGIKHLSILAWNANAWRPVYESLISSSLRSQQVQLGRAVVARALLVVASSTHRNYWTIRNFSHDSSQVILENQCDL